MTDLKERVRNVIAATFGVPSAAIDDETNASSVEHWDSMNHLHLIVALEAEFGVSLEPEQAIEMTSVRAIETTLLALGAR